MFFNSQYSELTEFLDIEPNELDKGIYNSVIITKDKKNRDTDDPKMFYYSVHKAELHVSIFCKERWELTHYLKKPLEVNGHLQKYQADVKRCQFLT